MFNGKLVEVDDNQITINAEYLGTGLDIYQRDLLRDIIFQHWRGHNITVSSRDGEPIWDFGIVEFISQLCYEFSIPKDLVTFVTHDDREYPGFKKQRLPLLIFVAGGNFISDHVELDSDAKYIGFVVKRYSPFRLRTMYEIAQQFPGDCFLISHDRPQANDQRLQAVSHLYEKELSWLHNYQFEQDIDSSGVTDWMIASYENYHRIWNRFQIEIVSETHPSANSTYWMTEKTSRCLATGKPFLLLAGTNALTRLRSMGFKTFNDVIDESYDQELSWPLRLNKILQSLKQLKSRTDFNSALQQMYTIAEYNKQWYPEYVAKFGS